MNTSQPISSFIAGVSYGFLSREDVRRLSAKRITSATTLDTLLNPVPAGLYAPELGQFGDNPCLTCGLKTPQCPGHCGHIELPVPCYHPTFMDQILRLLRAQCVYCNKLKLSRVDVNRYICKLRLLRYGLLEELRDLDDLDLKLVTKGLAKAATEDEEGNESEADDDSDQQIITEARLTFVRKAIERFEEQGSEHGVKSEAVALARRAVVSEFLAAMNKSRNCKNCNGINHSYRKDRFVKIFRKPLTQEQRNKMIQAGLKVKDAVVTLAKRKRDGKEHARKRARHEDEGIADMDRSSEEESTTSESEVEIAGGDIMEMDAAETQTKQASNEETYLNPSRVLAQLNELFVYEQPVLALLYGKRSGEPDVTADMFFMQDVLVPPNRYRPEARQGKDEIAEAQENTLYKNIITASDQLTVIQRELKDSSKRNPRYRARTYVDFETAWITLQDAVNSMIDKDRNPLTGAAGLRNPEGVKQKLEKKEGLFRKNMMGKRVNFAARTVISPDPNIETNEIGVPPVFALKLTYPEPVTPYNIEELQEAVRNGPQIWPGATAIENESGLVISLDRKNAEERTALANQLLAPSISGLRGTRPKKVYRHLNNGDIVIMNRQPTLHKPSMMCHRARVLPGEKTLRMHYANCNTYNADFDGDEMNMHFPQNEIARAEALSIADTDHQYLSATAGEPLRGLIQDHISISVILTSRDTFFTREEYMQLLYAALRPENGHCVSGRLETVPPAVMRPRKLWTGKQVITSVLKNIMPIGHQGLTLNSKSKTTKEYWGPDSEEEEVVFKDGELIHGILDKKQIGPSAGGLVNAIYEVYGHTVAGRLLSVLGRLLTKLLHMRAHSCGVADLIFSRDGEVKRREALKDSDTVGLSVASEYVSLDGNVKSEDPELKRRLEDVLRDETKQVGLDNRMKGALAKLTSEVTLNCLPNALVKPFPRNQMQLMTASGAKGSQVNANQISCNLGQQVLEGRRVPVMISGKTLPCFKPFESSARAGGYIVDRFLTGIRPQEYFFHAMAGREGLIDTAVKTSRSGYLQRCLVKGMEGLKVQHDTSVRDSDGSVIQFLYGEDGLDVAKAKYMQDFTFAAQNHMSMFQSLGISEDWARVMSEEAREATKTAEKLYRKSGGDLSVSDPAISVWNPAQNAGAMSERVYGAMREYISENPERLIKDRKKGIEVDLSKKNFQAILELRYLRSVVEAGEAVGVVAGQSVGEPSTQMTLNTFHLAGHSTKNVTLGIPRLRELVMTAAVNISSPLMTLRLTVEEDAARKFAKGISRLSLAQIIDKVSIKEKTGQGIGYTSAKTYEIKLELFPKEEYAKEYAITADDVVATIEHRFLPRLQTSVRKEMAKRGEEKTLKAKSDALPEIGKSAGAIELHTGRADADRVDGGDDSDVDDGDATGAKSRANQRQDGYDDLEDDEERAIAAKARHEDDEDASDVDETYHSQDSDSDNSDDETIQKRKDNAAERESRIKSNKATSDVAIFRFDEKKADSCTFSLEYAAETAKVLMLNLVEQAARTALIQSVSGIASAEYDTEASLKAKTPIIVTEGSNIRAMWDYQHVVHPHYLYTNNIHEILVTYGVEAARAAIQREVHSVFDGHGIAVDARHLTLIADYMTRGGGYSPFNRMGYQSNTSPFMKMSFETTVGFLRDAVLDGDYDNLTNPSARIVVGRINNVGTGGFDVLTDLTKCKRRDTTVKLPVLSDAEVSSDDE